MRVSHRCLPGEGGGHDKVTQIALERAEEKVLEDARPPSDSVVALEVEAGLDLGALLRILGSGGSIDVRRGDLPGDAQGPPGGRHRRT